MKENQAKLKLIISMIIFGTIGIFRTYIPYSSGFVAFARGLIGTLFIIAVMLFKRIKINKSLVKKNLLLLCISGALIGFNWIFLFEAYRYTSVSTATLCYYMAPVIVILLAPIVLKEKQSPKKIFCSVAAIIGAVLISGVFGEGIYGLRGVLFGLSAAFLYASVILMNKFIRGLGDYEKTLVQLGTAAITILPYVLLTDDLSSILVPNVLAISLLVVVGIIHTGLAYTLYFGSVEKIKVQTSAIFSYIDPVTALVLSAVILHEDFGLLKLIGSVLILGATLISEIETKNRIGK